MRESRREIQMNSLLLLTANVFRKEMQEQWGLRNIPLQAMGGARQGGVRLGNGELLIEIPYVVNKGGGDCVF